MKTIEQTVEVIKRRITRLEQNMEMIQDKPEHQIFYTQCYEKHSELEALLGYIEETAQACPPTSCGGCKTPCGSKRG